MFKSVKPKDNDFMIQVVLTTSGKFHTFHLACQMYKHGVLRAIYTGYPRFKLRTEAPPASLIRSSPLPLLLYLAAGRVTQSDRFLQRLGWFTSETIDRYACATLPPCDVFVGLSCSGLHTGRKAQKRGAVYVCDRGSTHIRYQNQILADEYARQGRPFTGIDPRVIEKEEQEYAAADIITVPSTFAERSFLEMGVAEKKLRVIPYGVSLTRFHPMGEPDPDSFDVLFVGGASIRKGIRYLLEGFEALAHPRKRLTFAGVVLPETRSLIEEFSRRLHIICLGTVPQPVLKEVMSGSHVMVLPSIEDGFGMVISEAMACGCPVICSENCGGGETISDGKDGFIVPIRDSAAVAERLQHLADDADLRLRMSQSALARVQSFGGWDNYGDRMFNLFSGLCGVTSAILPQHLGNYKSHVPPMR